MPSSHLVFAYLGIVLLAGCSDLEKKAETLLTEASRLTHLAQEAEKTNYSTAAQLYAEALGKAEAIITQYPLSQVATQIAQNQVKIGSYMLGELRDTILPRAKDKAEAETDPLACALLVTRTIADTVSRANLTSEIATYYADSGQADRVLQIIKAMKATESTGNVVSEILSRYLSSGRYDQALQIAHAIDGDSLTKDWALSRIASEASGAGHCEKAYEIANTLSDVYSKIDALIRVASGCMLTGDQKQATQVLSLALQLTDRVTDSSRRLWALEHLSRTYAEASQYDQALRVAHTIDDPLTKADTLAEIARKAAETGQHDQALQISNSIEDHFARYGVLMTIADKYAEANQKDKAAALLEQALDIARVEIEDALSPMGRRLRGQRRIRDPLAPGRIGSFNATALAEIASKYVVIGRKEKALEVLAQALETAQTIESAYSQAKALSRVSQGYAEAGQYDRALQIADMVTQPDLKSDALAVIARKYAELGLYEQAFLLAEAITYDRLRREVLADLYAQTGRKEQAEELFNEDWRNTHWQARWEEMARMAGQYADAGLYDIGLQIANFITDPLIKATTLHSLAKKFIETGQNEKAAEALSEALQAAQTIQAQLSSESSVIVDIALTYADSGQYDAALEAAYALRAETLTVQTLAKIGVKSAANSQKEKTTAIFAQALEVAKTMEQVSKGQALADIAIQYAEAGFYAQALETAGMIEADPTVKSWVISAITQRATQTNPCDQVSQLAHTKDIMALAEKAAQCARSETPEKAAAALSQALAAAKALESSPGVIGNMVGIVARKYAEAGLYDQALDIANTIASPSDKAATLAEIASKYAEAGSQQQALEILLQAQALANTLEEGPSRDGTLEMIATEYAKAGYPDKAFEITQHLSTDLMVQHQIFPETARQYAVIGQCDQALRIADLIDLAHTKAVTLAEIALWCARTGQEEKSAAMLSQSLQMAKDLDSMHPAGSVGATITQKYIEAGQYDQALQVVTVIGDPVAKARMLTEIVRQCPDTKCSEQAIHIADTIGNAPSKEEVLFAVAQKYAESGTKEKAGAIFRQALRAANSREDDSEAAWTRNGALSNVAEEYVETGRYEQALVIASTMKDDTPQAGVLASVAAKYAAAGMKEQASELVVQALQIAKTRKDAESKARALVAIGFPYAKAGQQIDDNAKKILHEMITELGDSPWREQPSATVQQRDMWGVVRPGGSSLYGYSPTPRVEARSEE